MTYGELFDEFLWWVTCTVLVFLWVALVGGIMMGLAAIVDLGSDRYDQYKAKKRRERRES